MADGQGTGGFQQAFLGLVVAIVWASLILQFVVAFQNGFAAGTPAPLIVANVLSYFTILSNLIVAVVSTAALLAPASPLARRQPLAAAAMYIAVVGIIFGTVLHGMVPLAGLHLIADTGLHYVTPAAYVVWWLVFAPKAGLRYEMALVWLVYPLAYVGYTLVRGLIDGRYFYPFTNVTDLGYPRVLQNAALIVALFYLVGLAIVFIARRLEGAKP